MQAYWLSQQTCDATNVELILGSAPRTLKIDKFKYESWPFFFFFFCFPIQVQSHSTMQINGF